MKNFREIKNAVEENLNESFSVQFWILPGSKNKGISYDKIKRLVINEFPVPSQMILISTLKRGKNLRSIVSMMLIQTAGKLGMIPWALDELPFVDEPTMIIAFHKMSKGKSMIFSAVATSNETFSTYWNNSAFESEELIYKDFII